ncbi:MAG TPA: hypothetical protein ENN80_10295, partial [Candidatus Hydrogenedentes bacterium]|nr:hypothetical protein [Candidatus Hydrogenedentota bacterium]
MISCLVNGGALRQMLVCFAALCLIGVALPAFGATYYVANSGSDDNAGLSPDAPWASLAQVNTAALEAGDSVLFKRGDMWRGQLAPQSGSAEGGHITYGAYGEGPKPRLLGSVAKNSPGDWRDEGGNIWSTGGLKGVSGEGIVNLLPNSGFDTDTAGWSLHTEGGARVSHGRDTEHFATGPAGYRITCHASGERPNHIQFSASRFPIERNAVYRLRFSARASEPFEMYQPIIMKSGRPWTHYARPYDPRNFPVTIEWTVYTHYYAGIEWEEDGRLTFFLGDGLPAGTTLYLDDIRLERLEGELLPRDVGNIIFDHGPVCG